MSDLASSPLRILALVLAAVAIIPSAVVILPVLGKLHDPGATSRQRAMDVVWTVLPLAGLVLLLVLAARA